jgi:hypothetical protein
MYYWHFVILYRDQQNFSVCYRTISPLGNIGKYFAIIKRKVIFPILQILILGQAKCAIIKSSEGQANSTDMLPNQNVNKAISINIGFI